MFGLRNMKGSCWVNATLQALFRIPQLQERYSQLNAEDTPADLALQKVFNTHGDGLPEFYKTVRTEDLPAGEDIGDAAHVVLEPIQEEVLDEG